MQRRTVLRGEPLHIRLWAQVRTTGPRECWPWVGPKDPDGYGRIESGRHRHPVHRVALEIHLRRALRPNHVAAHRCDNPPCCNPEHLFEATRAENNQDAKHKGRTARGERNGAAKLTATQVVEIVNRRIAGESAGELAKEFGVSSRQIYYLARAERWRHVPKGSKS
jgi:hypothetical protein